MEQTRERVTGRGRRGLEVGFLCIGIDAPPQHTFTAGRQHAGAGVHCGCHRGQEDFEVRRVDGWVGLLGRLVEWFDTGVVCVCRGD